MIKGSLLTGLGQRKRFASHEAGELHRMLSAFICSPENPNVCLLTSCYCEIPGLHWSVHIDRINAIVSLQCATDHSETDAGVPRCNCNKLLSLFLIPMQIIEIFPTEVAQAGVNIESATPA